MSECRKCKYKFSYLEMLKAKKHIDCPSCGAMYKIELNINIVFYVVIAGCILSLKLIDHIYPSSYNWIGFSIVLPILYFLMPFIKDVVLQDKR